MRPKSATLCTLATAQLLIAACSDGRPPTDPFAAARGDKSARDLGPADFTSLLYPGAAGTLALGINEHGDTVGRYSSAGRTHGFLRDEAGTYSTIDYPGSNFSGRARSTTAARSSAGIPSPLRPRFGMGSCSRTAYSRRSTRRVRRSRTRLESTRAATSLAATSRPAGSYVDIC